jgi:hypothetical protein
MAMFIPKTNEDSIDAKTLFRYYFCERNNDWN